MVASQAVQGQILALAATGRVDRITADDSGDPFFTNRRYFPLFAFLRRTGVPFRLDTNAAYIDTEGLAELVDSRLWELNFSLDAATLATHRRLRGGRIAERRSA